MNIWIASADNLADKVKHYIEKEGMSPNSKDENGYTPLHAAAEWGHMELIAYLVEKGGDLNITDSDGDTPLHATENVEMAKLLVELGADPKKKNSDGLTPLEKAQEEDPMELSDLITFYRELNGEKVETLPEDMSVSMSYTDEVSGEPLLDEEQRKKLEEIVQREDETELASFIQNALLQAQSKSQTPSKRQHLDENDEAQS